MDILDCTLRDGSYVNGFQFTKKDAQSLCQQLENVRIRYIEIEHGLGLGAYRKWGIYEAAATDEEYLIASSPTHSQKRSSECFVFLVLPLWKTWILLIRMGWILFVLALT